MKTPNILFQRNVYSSYFSLAGLILTVSCFALPAFAAGTSLILKPGETKYIGILTSDLISFLPEGRAFSF